MDEKVSGGEDGGRGLPPFLSLLADACSGPPLSPRSSASELSLQEGETDGQERPLCALVEFGVKVKVTLATVTGRNCALSKFIY